MRFYHLIFLVVLILVGASLSQTIHKYLTFLPTY
jgi:hypothetical protein